MQHKPILIKLLAPSRSLVTLKGGLVLPVEAIELAIDLERRGIRLATDENAENGDDQNGNGVEPKRESRNSDLLLDTNFRYSEVIETEPVAQRYKLPGSNSAARLGPLEAA